MTRRLLAGLALSALTASGCANSNEDYVADLRAAMDEADVSLREAVGIAEADEANAEAIRAALLVDGTPRFSVRALSGDTGWKFRLSLAGTVQEKSADVSSGGPCEGSIGLVEALEIAEQEAGGDAVAVVPDDDVACAFEIQVLTPDTLWEVKVSSSGEVLESEESDEDGTGDEDDDD